MGEISVEVKLQHHILFFPRDKCVFFFLVVKEAGLVRISVLQTVLQAPVSATGKETHPQSGSQNVVAASFAQTLVLNHIEQ